MSIAIDNIVSLVGKGFHPVEVYTKWFRYADKIEVYMKFVYPQNWINMRSISRI